MALSTQRKPRDMSDTIAGRPYTDDDNDTLGTDTIAGTNPAYRASRADRTSTDSSPGTWVYVIGALILLLGLGLIISSMMATDTTDTTITTPPATDQTPVTPVTPATPPVTDQTVPTTPAPDTTTTSPPAGDTTPVPETTPTNPPATGEQVPDTSTPTPATPTTPPATAPQGTNP